MTHRTRILLTLLGIGWGLHIVLSKAIGAEGAREALAYLVLYMCGASAGLIGMGFLISRPKRPTRRHLVFFTVGSIFGYLGPITVELIVAPQLDAALLSLINATSPIITLAIAVPIGAAVLTRRVGLALALGSAAAVLILAPSVALPSAAALGWVLAGFLLPLFYGIDNVYMQVKWPEDLDSFQVAAGEGAVAALMAFGLAAAWGVRPADVGAALEAGWQPLLALAIVAVGTIWLFFYLVSTAGAVAVSFAGFVTIATGVVFGYLLFDERPDIWVWAACLLTVAALWVLRSARGGGEAPEARAEQT